MAPGKEADLGWLGNNRTADPTAGSNSRTRQDAIEASAESFDGDVSEWDVSNVTDMARMFEDSGLSTENYDALLVEWQHLDLEADVRFSARDTQYSPCAPAAARQYIVDEYDWDITDGGLAG